MASQLPDELVKDVLHSILDIPDHEFHDTTSQSPFARVVAPSSTALLVCKRWMRIATPLLYHNVVLRSTETVHSFCLAIKRQPEFAKLVKHLRVECACPNIIGDAAKKMTTLTTLHINLASLADERLLGVTKLLAASNATHLSLAQNRPFFVSISGAQKRLGVVSKWKNLRILTLPQYDGAYNIAYVTRNLLNLATGYMFLDELQVPVAKPHDVRTLLEHIPDIVNYIQSATAGTGPVVTFVMRDWRLIDPKIFDRPDFDGKAHRAVRFRGRTSVSTDIYGLGDLAAAHGFSDIATLWSNPLDNTPVVVQRKIWQRIAGYAMFSEQKPVYLRGVWFVTASLDVQSAGALLLLNKDFADIVLSTLAEAVELGSSDDITVNLASQLQCRPEIASAVKTLTLRWSSDIIGDVVAEFNQLRRLTLSLNYRIDLVQLFELFDASKMTLRVLSVQQIGFWGGKVARRKCGNSDAIEPMAVETAPVADASRLVDGMNALNSLNWNAARASFIAPPQFNTLLALTELEFTVDCESASRWLAKCQLPLLTKLTLIVGAMYTFKRLASVATLQEDECSPESSLNLFLQTHGRKIQRLRLRPYRLPFGEILQACPNVRHMVVTESTSDLEGLHNTPATKLKTLRIEFNGDPKSFRNWFGDLVTSICNGGLSALEQLVVKTASSYNFWDTPSAADVEGAAETPWQGDASEKLKARGVVLTDTDGRIWRPRLVIQDVLRRSSRVTTKPSGRR